MGRIQLIDELVTPVPQLMLAIRVLEFLDAAYTGRNSEFEQPSDDSAPEYDIKACLKALQGAGIDLDRYHWDAYDDYTFLPVFLDVLTLLETNTEQMNDLNLNIAPLINTQTPDETGQKDVGIIRSYNKAIEWHKTYFDAFAKNKVTDTQLTS